MTISTIARGHSKKVTLAAATLLSLTTAGCSDQMIDQTPILQLFGTTPLPSSSFELELYRDYPHDAAFVWTALTNMIQDAHGDVIFESQAPGILTYRVDIAGRFTTAEIETASWLMDSTGPEEYPVVARLEAYMTREARASLLEMRRTHSRDTSVDEEHMTLVRRDLNHILYYYNLSDEPSGDIHMPMSTPLAGMSVLDRRANARRNRTNLERGIGQAFYLNPTMLFSLEFTSYYFTVLLQEDKLNSSTRVYMTNLLNGLRDFSVSYSMIFDCIDEYLANDSSKAAVNCADVDFRICADLGSDSRCIFDSRLLPRAANNKISEWYRSAFQDADTGMAVADRGCARMLDGRTIANLAPGEIIKRLSLVLMQIGPIRSASEQSMTVLAPPVKVSYINGNTPQLIAEVEDVIATADVDVVAYCELLLSQLQLQIEGVTWE